MNNSSLLKLLLLVGVLVLIVPTLLVSLFSFGTETTGMMGGMGFFAMPMFFGWFIFCAVVIGGGYLLFQSTNDATQGRGQQPTEADLDRRIERGEVDEDAALATLRARYARDELSEAEFERKVETLLETETPETAREQVRERN